MKSLKYSSQIPEYLQANDTPSNFQISISVIMFLSNAEPERRTSLAIAPASNPIASNLDKFPRAIRALTIRYQKKAAKMGMGMEWIDAKVMDDVEIVKKEYLSTGKGQPSDDYAQSNHRLIHEPPNPLTRHPSTNVLKPKSASYPPKSYGTSTETKNTIQSLDFKSRTSDKQLRALQEPVYTSFSSLGLREPAGPKRVDTSNQEDSATASPPPTAMQQIKIVLGIEPPQK
ncbi:hypothetical protein BPAE_0070g00100 [Botrytis paeoniae]|uniref:Uncharacterized protein n=1 Tax=Botrytis paeoniae TaxID=278948 RepID=A0A4Z1FRA4_9HELO|nr:hypothetical protein BPAE_0070g00100 [Botrytis paeoniae]